MLNKDNLRELAYVAEVKAIDPIVGSDNCESATINGWHVMVRKNEFHVGDKCVYFEIDSRLNTDVEAFAFLARCNGKIKTQKYTFGGKGLFFSQGLILSLEQCGLNPNDYKVGDFLTEKLGITYADDADNKRKANDKPQYNATFKKIKKWKVVRFIMRYALGRKLLFALFGVKKKKKTSYPWFVVKSDEDRIQCKPDSLFADKHTTYEITEKVDGSSTTVAIERLKRDKYKLYICSRNVVVWDSITNKIKAGGYYANLEKNPFIASAEQYQLCEFLTSYMNHRPDVQWTYLQGETYGAGIQKRTYHLNETDFRAFTLVDSQRGRYTYSDMATLLNEYDIPSVPILQTGFVLPDTCDEVVAMASGDSKIDGEMREGIVLRSEQDTSFSFKAVDPNFLVKYHG